MKAAKSTVSRRAFALLAFAVALPLAAAEITPIAVENGAVEPLAGRDYTMRVDVAAARFERYDAATGRIEQVDLARAGAAAVAPGLWLAVPQPGAGTVELLPVGTNPSAASANAAALSLPPAVAARLAADGGVIYVDAGVRAGDLAATNGVR